MLQRHESSAFRRETIASAKTSVGMISRYLIHMMYKNYIRPQYTKPHKLDPDCNKRTPAMAIHLESRPSRFDEVFHMRISPAKLETNKEWSGYLIGLTPYGRRRPKSAA